MARPRSNDTVQEVMPGSGLEIFQVAGRSTWYVRRYCSNAQAYIKRSTGQKTPEDAKAWVLNNLQSIFAAELEKRTGGNYSVTRQLSAHMHYLDQRHQAGEISESTLIGYQKCSRHWVRWFSQEGIKKLGQLDNDVFKRYGLNRINLDGMSPNTVNFEIVYIRMWISWLNDEGIHQKVLKVPSVRKAVENRTGTEPFLDGDLKLIKQTIRSWVNEESNNQNFGKQSVSLYNKLLFQLFIELLDESGARQHELWGRTWREISVGETLTDRKRIINTIKIPQKAKRGARQTVFRGEALIKMKELHRKMCNGASSGDFIFRSQQTNTQIDISTFTRYWSLIRAKCNFDYKLHTFRSHRITQLIMSGIEPQLVARNLGLSLAQIEASYLRFTPAGHFNQLVQDELPQDNELRKLM